MPISKSTTQVLVFDLSYDPILTSYIPSAFIVEAHEGILYYIIKNANSQTIEEFQLDLSKEEIELLKICEKLNPNELLKKYKIKNKVAKSLELLLSDPKSKKIIDHFLNFSLESFFKIISKKNFPLSIDSNKKDVFHKQLVVFSSIVLEPKFYFSKTSESIVYQLSITENEREFFPFEQNFKILLDQPSWVCTNQKIHTISHINANKLKPFLTKKEVIIPNKNSMEYFDKFIKNVIKKAPVEAEGFSIVSDSTFKKTIIRPIVNFESPVYFLELIFVYEHHRFSICDQKNKQISLINENFDEITVLQTIRNEKEEQTVISYLKNIGFYFMDNKLATLSENLSEIDKYYNIQELIHIQNKINDPSIEIDLVFNKQTISLESSQITTNFTENKDWFDIEMIIEIGEIKLPFPKIIPNLKTGNRWYELENGRLFLIPIEWFSDYKSLTDFGKTQNDLVKIQKNQFTILEETGIAKEDHSFNKEIIPYKTTGNIKATLRNYQNEGVNWLVKNYQLGLGSCLADDMGLGKTIQSLAYLDFVYTNFDKDFLIPEEPDDSSLDLFSSNLTAPSKRLKALVVAPSSLTYNWFNETKKFAPHFTRLNYTGLDRKTKRKKIEKVDLVFTSYGLLLKDIHFLKNIPFNFLLIDESQQIKNRNSKIYKAISTINALHKISLSGTPIENSLSDLWSQMQFTNPNLLSSFSFFETHFKKPIEKNKDEQKVKELKSLINPYLLRRTKKEVAKDLPEISEQIFYSQMEEEQAKLYEKEKSIIRNYLIDKQLNIIEKKPESKISILNALSKLRQIANHPVLLDEKSSSGKFTDVSAYIETLLQSNQKTLVFSSYTSHLKIYTDWCDQHSIPYCLLTGSTHVKDRETQVNNFQNNDSISLFFISLKAGGTGLNLTKASYVILLDPWWNPFAELQAIGRAHRIGQKNQVNVIRFIAKDTIEEKINLLQQSKKEIADSIIENSLPDEILNNIDYILE